MQIPSVIIYTENNLYLFPNTVVRLWGVELSCADRVVMRTAIPTTVNRRPSQCLGDIEHWRRTRDLLLDSADIFHYLLVKIYEESH